jgi:hypothetical protein
MSFVSALEKSYPGNIVEMTVSRTPSFFLFVPHPTANKTTEITTNMGLLKIFFIESSRFIIEFIRKPSNFNRHPLNRRCRREHAPALNGGLCDWEILDGRGRCAGETDAKARGGRYRVVRWRDGPFWKKERRNIASDGNGRERRVRDGLAYLARPVRGFVRRRRQMLRSHEDRKSENPGKQHRRRCFHRVSPDL